MANVEAQIVNVLNRFRIKYKRQICGTKFNLPIMVRYSLHKKNKCIIFVLILIYKNYKDYVVCGDSETFVKTRNKKLFLKLLQKFIRLNIIRF